MLSTVRDTIGCRISTGEAFSGRVKDIYFDDRHWNVRYLVVTLRSGLDEVTRLVRPEHLLGFDSRRQRLVLSLSDSQFVESPSPDQIRPVCKQYEALATGSPGSWRATGFRGTLDPHLRSWSAVSTLDLEYSGEIAGRLYNMAFEQGTGSIRYLQVCQGCDGKIVHFQMLPTAIERISWAAGRIFLRYLAPVQIHPEIDSGAIQAGPVAA